MEGIHLDMYPLPEEDEDDSDSLVKFFKDVNMDLNASMSSYLGSQASNTGDRVSTHSAAITVTGEVSHRSANMGSATNSEEGRRSESVTSRPNEASHSSSAPKSLGGSDSVALPQVGKDLQALVDVILSTRQHISRCGLNSSPLTALHTKLTASQKEMVQLLDGASTGQGLLRKSAKVELMRFVLRTVHAILCALVEQVGLLQNEASFVNQLKQDVEGHQSVLMSEQRELQEIIRRTKEKFLLETEALRAHKLLLRTAKEELAHRTATKATSPPVKHVQVTKYIHSSVPGRAETTALVRSQQEQHRVEKKLVKSEQERKGLRENLLRTKAELSATRESLELLKKHHEALQRNSMKTTAELQRKLHAAEEEVARSKVALSMEKHKSGRVSKLADMRGNDLSHVSLEAAVSGKTVGHLNHIVQQQQRREESLRQQLALSQSAVREREEWLRRSAGSLVQQKRREEAMVKTAKWRVLKSKGDKLAKSPLGGQLQVPCCLQGQLETTKECQKQHKPPPCLSLNIEELQDLAHFEDQETAAATLKWLNDTLS